MSQLFCSDIEIINLQTTSQVSDEDIKKIDRKSGHSRNRNLSIFLQILTTVFVICSLLFYPKGIVASCLLFIVTLPKLISCIKNRKIHACYAVVTDKKERWGKVGGKNNPTVMPYSQTDCIGSSNQKHHLTYDIKSFYFCTVEIYGEIFENVCCFGKDYDKINVGDTVVISGNTGIPIVYERTKGDNDEI